MLLSVVLVVRKHQAWVRPSLRSILDQAPDDLDLVVVDDGSNDHTARIVAEVAAGDQRVRVHRSETQLGTSAALETGRELARGDYVWFFDAADLMLPGAFAAVTSGLASAPDVLLVGEIERDIFGKDRRPDAGPRGRPVMRNRLVRREHLLGIDMRPGAHRDESRFASAVLAAATTVEQVDTPVHAHRLLPARVVQQWTHGDPWYADAPDARGPEIARPKREAGWRHVNAGLTRARRPAAATVRGVARRVPRSRTDLRKAVREVRYAAERRKPLDPALAVFAAYWGAAYSCNPRAIYEKAGELVPWLRGVWVVKAGSEHVIPPGVEHVVEGSREYYRVMARATYFVNNVNFPNDIVKRRGQVHLQTHHGTPLKTMGLDLVNARHSSLGLNFKRLMKRVERWDYSISANEFTTEIWERVYPSGTYESLETGYPRNDVLATATAEHRDRVRAELGLAPGQKAVLYTPTHREYSPEYVSFLDLDALVAELGPDVVVLMRAHYFYRGADTAGASERIVDVAAHPSIEDLAIASDLLVTDYSSLMFDYAVLDRPIVIYAPDWETYRAERGTYFDLMAEPPGAVATTQAELTDVLRSGQAEDAVSAALRSEFRARYCSLEDGRAAERVVRRLWPGSPGLAPPRGDDERHTRTTTTATAVKEEA